MWWPGDFGREQADDCQNRWMREMVEWVKVLK